MHGRRLQDIVDLLVIGAGPTGMACAIEAQRAGFTAVLVDKGCLCNSLFHYPAQHDFLHHAGAAGDRQHAVLQPEPEAESQRSAGVLPQGRRALPAGRSAVRDGRARRRRRWKFTVHTIGPVRPHVATQRAQARDRYRLLRSAELPWNSRRRSQQGQALLP